jgi:hypothetical protein
MATLAPSAARRFAIAAPMPREPPVTSATLLVNLDIASPMVFSNCSFDVRSLQPDLALRGMPDIPNGNAQRGEEARSAHNLFTLPMKRMNRYSLHSYRRGESRGLAPLHIRSGRMAFLNRSSRRGV